MVNKKDTLISLIVPTYNRPTVLIKTIDSYISALLPFNSEIIIVDDGSSLSYNCVIKKLESLNLNFKYIKNPKKLSLPLARNKGIKSVSKNCRFIFFGEDDVFLLKDTISLMYEILTKENADIVGCNVKYLADNNYMKYVDEKIILNHPKCYKDIFKLKSIHLAKIELYESIKFDKRYIINSYREETDFFLTVFKTGYKIIFVENYLAFNLPRKECRYGGEWDINPSIYELASIYNNFVFYLKHIKFFLKQTSVLEIIKEILKFSFQRVRIMVIKLIKSS
ncbi:MAG: glycosyltransferase family 2 protein [Endomicrobiia bacterium]